VDRKEFKESMNLEMDVEKQIQAQKQKQVDDEFLELVDESIEKDKKLLKRLAKV